MDHASELLTALETFLTTDMPVAGGWLLTRMQKPTYPFGTIDLTSSSPLRGQAYYGELHTGVISLWVRAPVGQPPDPRQAFALANEAHTKLGAAILSSGSFVVSQFSAGVLTPRNPDGLTWGRSFTFTAVTHEVQNV